MMEVKGEREGKEEEGRVGGEMPLACNEACAQSHP